MAERKYGYNAKGAFDGTIFHDDDDTVDPDGRDGAYFYPHKQHQRDNGTGAKKTNFVSKSSGVQKDHYAHMYGFNYGMYGNKYY